MTMGNWDDSTAGAFLAGANLPPQGLAVTLVSIRTDMMDKRDVLGQQEQVFIGKFSDHQMEWIINKTGRRFLKDECGINNTNISGFQPIPLTLLQNPTNFGVGIRPIPRVAQPEAPATAPPAQQQTPVVPDGEVPF